MKPSGPIVVAVTDSEASVRAVEYAAGFLAEPGDELLLVHVLYEAPLLCLVSLLHRPLARSTAFLQRRFAPALSAAAAAGVSHRFAVLRGEACCGARVSVAQALCLQAREVRARALVLGSSGAPCALGRLLGRSTLAKQITRAVLTPVIVAPARPAAPPGKQCGKGASARVAQTRKRSFLEAISPRAGNVGGGAIGAWPLQPRLSYNKLRGDEANCQQSDEAVQALRAPLRKGGADWQPEDSRGQVAAAPQPRPLSPERAAVLSATEPAAAVDAAAYLRRAAEAQRRAEAAGGRGRSAHHGGQESASALLAEGLLPQRTNPNPLTVLPLSAAPRPKSRAVQSGASDLTRLLLSAPSRGPLPY